MSVVANVRARLVERIRKLQVERKEVKLARRRVKNTRARLAKLERAKVHPPLKKVTQDSWGWAPGHDGIDLLCPPQEPIFAMVKSKVVRADTGGWWGKGPTGDVSKGDGIVVLEVLEAVGPFKPGLKLCYGHAEEPIVRVGQVVNAGQRLGRAGFANAWHIHFMVHGRSDVRGIGDRDPRPYYRYSVDHS